MKTNNLIKILIIVVILLSIGLTATSIKLISLDKKVNNIENKPMVQNPIEEEPGVDESVIEEPIIEKPIVVGPVEPNNPPVIKEPNKVIVKPKYISKEQAMEIGINKVGKGAKLILIESDLDNNPPKYELEIILDNYEYELEIHAITGAIIDFDKDEIDD